MMYDLVEVKPKLNKKKVIIVTIIVTILVLLFGILIVMKHHKKIENLRSKENNIITSQDNNKLEKKKKHSPTVNLLPVYSEQAKEKIKNIYHNQTEQKKVYFTFDDGPSKTVTPLILDLLKQEKVPATFFVLGSRAELNPDLIKREFAEGHYIANHGYSHIYGNIYASVESIIDEYNKTRDVIRNILGNEYDGHLFRFPGGSTGGKYKDIKNESKAILEQNEICYLDWNSLSQDAAGAKTKEALIENTKSSVGNKKTVVILMHDAGDKILTYEALPEIIQYLREAGYQFENFYNLMY